MSYDLSDYVDVAERMTNFYANHPLGSFQGEGEFVRDEQGRIVGYLYRALAYRKPDDERPGIGTAFEPIPGATPYTRNSEVMNAETSAWGRAIVACGFPSKKIASADEVRARSAGEPSATRLAGEPEPNEGAVEGGVSASPAENPAAKAQAAQEARRAAHVPQDDGKPENVELTFGKHKGQRLGEVPQAYRAWLLGNFEAKNAEQRRILAAAQEIEGVSGFQDPYPDVPF